MPYRAVTRKVRQVFFHHILHVDDSPERIALGAAIAVFVAWTPTVGLQMVLAVALATLIGANKAVTIPIVWLTNPITAVPIYWFNYKLGNMFLNGGAASEAAARAKIIEAARLTVGLEIFTASYWSGLFKLLVEIGWPVWMGSIVVGAGLAAVTYVAITRSIRRYRSRKGHADHSAAVQATGADRHGKQTAA